MTENEIQKLKEEQKLNPNLVLPNDELLKSSEIVGTIYRRPDGTTYLKTHGEYCREHCPNSFFFDKVFDSSIEGVTENGNIGYDYQSMVNTWIEIKKKEVTDELLKDIVQIRIKEMTPEHWEKWTEFWTKCEEDVTKMIDVQTDLIPPVVFEDEDDDEEEENV